MPLVVASKLWAPLHLSVRVALYPHNLDGSTEVADVELAEVAAVELAEVAAVELAEVADVELAEVADVELAEVAAVEHPEAWGALC
jgi:hypothetical protein